MASPTTIKADLSALALQQVYRKALSQSTAVRVRRTTQSYVDLKNRMPRKDVVRGLRINNAIAQQINDYLDQLLREESDVQEAMSTSGIDNDGDEIIITRKLRFFELELERGQEDYLRQGDPL